ncbi:MAG: glycosyltransferase family 2 protein [Bacteroidales bacterium]|nr:glycosyltransferase family 2 protein [Bacteroidales bacterium]
MIKESPRFSVIIITYNQEDVIERTLHSLLSQEYLYEICVSDDCSSDRTWEILNDYSLRYPGLFKLNRNEPNLGIFANVEKTWEIPTGDIIYRVSGDDMCCDGYFKAVADYIRENGIDFTKDLFCIVGNTIVKYPDGQELIHRNKLLDKGLSPLKLKLRGLLDDRSSCFSINILKKYIPVSKGRSFEVEEAQDDQLEIFSDRFYHIPVPGNIYFAEIGISSRMNSEIKKQRISLYNYLAEFLDRLGIELDRYDKAYLKYRTEVLKYNATSSVSYLAKALRYYFLSLDPSLGLTGLDFSHFFNAIKRRFKRK